MQSAATELKENWYMIFSNEFVKSDVVENVSMTEIRKDARKNKDEPDEKENPTNIGPGITESHEES